MKKLYFKELEKPIFIIGAPRSGTTLLFRILCAHKDLCGISEPRLIWRFGNDSKSDALSGEDVNDNIRAYIKNKFASRIKKSEGIRLLEKTPSNCLRLSFIDTIFPDAKYVHIIRDGYECVASIHKAWNPKFKTENHLSTSGLRPNYFRRWLVRSAEINYRQIPYYYKEGLANIIPRFLLSGSTQRLWGPRIPGITKMITDSTLLEVSSWQWKLSVESAAKYGRENLGHRYKEIRLESIDHTKIKDIIEYLELDDTKNSVLKEFDLVFRKSRFLQKRKSDLSARDYRKVSAIISGVYEKYCCK